MGGDGEEPGGEEGRGVMAKFNFHKVVVGLPYATLSDDAWVLWAKAHVWCSEYKCWEIPSDSIRMFLRSCNEDAAVELVACGIWEKGGRGWIDVALRDSATAPLRRFRGQATFVYFIQCGSNGPIKIGWAADPAVRLAELQSANPLPLTLIGSFIGDRSAEAALHREFQEYRLHGEWFRPTPAILARAAAGNRRPEACL